MRQLSLALALLFVFATNGLAANISGEYIEARTCNVYTGPCFATAENTIGYDGIFPLRAGKMNAVILVDQKASPEQFAALVDFVKDTAQTYTKHVVKVRRAPIELKNNHLTKQAQFKAGKVAEIKTRALKKSDCVCTNEVVYYQPLTKVENFSPAFSLKVSYQGKGLHRRFTDFGTRSAFLATFRR